MGSPNRTVRYAARADRLLSLDDLGAFLQEARLAGAQGREAIGIGERLWTDALRRVRVDVTPADTARPPTVYAEPPALAVQALRRHYSPQGLQELARLLTRGGLSDRRPTGRQCDTVERRALVTYEAPRKRTLTLEELAAFAHQATRLGARGSQHIEGQAKLFGPGLKWVGVALATRPVQMPATVCLESPAATAAALRRELGAREVRELARLLRADGAGASDTASPTEHNGSLRDRSRAGIASTGPTVTRKVKVEHETVGDLSLDDAAVFVREARRLGARGDETVKAGTPPRYHGPTLWNISVEVELPPAHVSVRRARTGTHRLVEAVEVLRRRLGPDDVARLVSFLVDNDVPPSTTARGAEHLPGLRRGGERPHTSREVKVEHPTRDSSLTLWEVHRFVRLAAQAGALGGETVRDPSGNGEPLSLSVDVEMGPLERVVANLRDDLPQNTTRALRSVYDADDLRELARLLAAEDHSAQPSPGRHA